MNIQMSWVRGHATANFFGREIPVLNRVRNHANGLRDLENPEEVIHTMPPTGGIGVPYMPSDFPGGIWRICDIKPKASKYLAPFFISTDAWQPVEEWATDSDGSYSGPTGRMVDDSGYGIHFSTSSTTLGCLRVVNESDLRWLVEQITATWAASEQVHFQVSEA